CGGLVRQPRLRDAGGELRRDRLPDRGGRRAPAHAPEGDRRRRRQRDRLPRGLFGERPPGRTPGDAGGGVITYRTDPSAVSAAELEPFFDGWPVAPAPGRRLAALRGADIAVLAYDEDRLIGFATALTDGALVAHVALLEVVPTHRRRGIGSELVREVRARSAPLYGLDLCCDEEAVPFYERLGFSRVAGMVERHAERLP